MKIHRIAGMLILSGCLVARSQVTGEVQLLISAESTTNMRDGTRGLQAYLTPVGPLEARVRAGRVTISHALDDTGAVLTQATTNKFYSVSVGRIDDSKDLTSREPTPFLLGGLSKGSKAIESVSGVLELVLPDLDPGSTVVIENIPAKYGSPVASEALARARVTLTVFDKKSACAAAGAKAPGGPQDYDSGTMFGAFFPLPPGFPRPGMEEGDVAVAIDDPDERLVGLEVQAADGSPLRYNHNGQYHSSGLAGNPGRRFDTYHLGTDLPRDARLVCWLITSTSLLRVPFHFDRLPVPAMGDGRCDLGTMTVRLAPAALSTRETLDYERGGSDARLTAIAPQGMENIVQLWCDVPGYVAILKRDMHYKTLPRLAFAVPPEFPAIPPPGLPPNTTITVLVSFAVDAGGRVEAARILQSDDARFDASAAGAVLRWRFRPAETEGGPAMAFVTVPVVFKVPIPEQTRPLPPPSG
jgi:TonB family protein